MFLGTYTYMCVTNCRCFQEGFLGRCEFKHRVTIIFCSSVFKDLVMLPIAAPIIIPHLTRSTRISVSDRPINPYLFWLSILHRSFGMAFPFLLNCFYLSISCEYIPTHTIAHTNSHTHTHTHIYIYIVYTPTWKRALGRPRRRWRTIFECILKKWVSMQGIGLIQLRIGIIREPLWMQH